MDTTWQEALALLTGHTAECDEIKAAAVRAGERQADPVSAPSAPRRVIVVKPRESVVFMS